MRQRALIGPLVLLAIVSVALGAPALAFAQRPGERTIPLNHKRIQIERLITIVAEQTGQPILFDDDVRGVVSIVTKRQVTLDEAWAILEASLGLLGFSLLPSTEEMWRIAKVATAVGEAPFRVAEAVPDGDSASLAARSESYVTTLLPLREAKVADVQKVLEPLSGARVTLVPYTATNSLIATGPERAIARLTTIADELDRVDEFELRLRVLRYRDIADIEPLVEAHLEAIDVDERRLQVWTDTRTNSVLFRGAADESARLTTFLDKLDRPLEGDGEVRILRVLHRDPEEVANLIRGFSEDPAASASPTASEGAAATAAARTELSGQDYVIAVDGPSRSLVVRASERGHRAIRDALEQLDAPPELIAIDLTVTEVRTPSNFALGFAFNLPASPGNDFGEVIARAISTPGGGGLLAVPNENTQIFGRVSRDAGVPFLIDAGNGIQIPVEDTAVIDGIGFRVSTEVLIQPSLVITAGEAHEIFVGDNIPIPTNDGGTSTGANGNTVTSTTLLSQTTTFNREDVGILLGIEAKAGEEGVIQLDLEIDISSVSQDSLAGSIEQVGPTLTSQQLVAKARLVDGATAIIAVDKETRSADVTFAVPFFSRIPFIGHFFRRESEEFTDTRLVIAARASRVSTPAELVADTIRRRLAFERHSARQAQLPAGTGAPFGVRVTTREREDDAVAIAEGLALQGYETEIHRWTSGAGPLFDVYVIALDSMAEAADVAANLTNEGWQADLVVLPSSRS